MLKELKIVWFIISYLLFLLFIVLYSFDGQFILHYTPTCYSVKYYNLPCMLCGMSRAFIKISEFKFSEAYSLNKGSLYLFFTFFINLVLVFSLHIKKYLLTKIN